MVGRPGYDIKLPSNNAEERMKKQLTNGSVEIKDIDVADKMILLGELGYSYQQLEKMMGGDTESDDTESDDEKEEEVSPDQMIFMGRLIKRFQDYIISLDITIKGKKVTDYQEAIRDQDFINEILPIASNCLLGDDGDEEKKPD